MTDTRYISKHVCESFCCSGAGTCLNVRNVTYCYSFLYNFITVIHTHAALFFFVKSPFLDVVKWISTIDFSGCGRRHANRLFQLAVVCVGIGWNESWRYRGVQYSCTSHQPVRPARNSHHQTIRSLSRTIKRLFLLHNFSFFSCWNSTTKDQAYKKAYKALYTVSILRSYLPWH